MADRTRLILALGAAVTAAVIAAGLTVIGSGSGPGDSAEPHPPARMSDAEQVGTVLPEPRPLPDVTLVRPNGTPWNTADLQENWHFLFFGFTHCPDVCPMTLADLAGAIRELRTSGEPVIPDVVLVSVDPQRDTPERLGQYVGHFSDDFLGVTGDRSAIDTLTGALGISYTLHEPDGDGHYAVDHTAAILLIDPQGRLRALWNPPHGRQTIADEFRQIHRQFGTG
ncbi:SCO family protein [Spiribacter sp. 2438]|uniref:SCO family protein n=1 Tax=Spiribacter sp. 2438 TaxID=2666185 RepID=UPI0018A2098E|nr:SCO family protein [Spiribacter sp. 2438]